MNSQKVHTSQAATKRRVRFENIFINRFFLKNQLNRFTNQS